MSGFKPVQRALLSVTDKTGLAEFAGALGFGDQPAIAKHSGFGIGGQRAENFMRRAVIARQPDPHQTPSEQALGRSRPARLRAPTELRSTTSC